MPESPEVDALATFLDQTLRDLVLTEVDILEFRVVKTRSRLPATLIGHPVTGARRYGKHVDIQFGPEHLFVSLGRHGWMRWSPPGADEVVEPPALASLVFGDAGELAFTDAGSWVSLGLSVVDDPLEVSAIAKLGPDPARPSYTREDFERALGGRRKQIKAILQEQESIAGIGNAYSDEILHIAKIAPVTHAAALSDDDVSTLYDATLGTIRGAIEARRGVPIDKLKEAKVASMRVHGRAGEACPVCGDTVLELPFASTTADYCPTCQNGGAPIAS